MTPPLFLFTLCALLFAATVPATAQDGGQLFTLYCSACHGTDGKGAGAGAFPALAGSPWIADDADRAIKVVLHGLSGPITVAGKTYNLEMPPQGATLPDEQIAAILTYARTSWGNKESAVTTTQVKAVRAANAGRTDHWTAPEILKLHPLNETPPIEDLISYLYLGEWKELPDFGKLKPKAVEEEHSGLIAIPKLGKTGKKNVAVIWEGTLILPADAEYDFYLAADDGGRLILDGTTLAEVSGIGPAQGREKETTAKFSAGPHKLRVEYYDVGGTEEIHVAWRKKGSKDWVWLSNEAQNANKEWPPIILFPSQERAVIYRNFVADTTPRAIGIGFPGGINMAYSADHHAPELIWTGLFIDAGHHWTARGQGNEPPAGEKVVKLTSKPALPATTKSRGYKLDRAGNPTFITEVGSLRLQDSYTPTPPAGLTRTLKVSGSSTNPENLTLAEGIPIKDIGSNAYELDGKVTLTVKAAKLVDGKTLVLPLAPGTTSELQYTWK